MKLLSFVVARRAGFKENETSRKPHEKRFAWGCSGNCLHRQCCRPVYFGQPTIARNSVVTFARNAAKRMRIWILRTERSLAQMAISRHRVSISVVWIEWEFYWFNCFVTDFPNLYPSNANYWIKLISPKHTRLVIHFSKIDLEEQNDCLYDYISIEDGESYESNLETVISLSTSLAMFNSNEISHFASDEYANDNVGAERFVQVRRHTRNSNAPPATTTNGRGIPSEPSFLPYMRWCGTHETNMTRFDFISATNMVLINFHSDYSVSGSGFALTWRAVPLNGCPTQTYTSIEDLSSISSPNYPNVLLNDLDCTYVIYATGGKKIWLEFHSFDLIRESHLEIDLGIGPFVPFQKSRQLNDGIFVSYQGRITVRLKTGSKPKGNGFHLTYKTCKVFLLLLFLFTFFFLFFYFNVYLHLGIIS